MLFISDSDRGVCFGPEWTKIIFIHINIYFLFYSAKNLGHDTPWSHRRVIPVRLDLQKIAARIWYQTRLLSKHHQLMYFLSKPVVCLFCSKPDTHWDCQYCCQTCDIEKWSTNLHYSQKDQPWALLYRPGHVENLPRCRYMILKK